MKPLKSKVVRVVFEMENGDKHELTPEQLTLTQCFPDLATLATPADEDGMLVPLINFPCGLTQEKR